MSKTRQEKERRKISYADSRETANKREQMSRGVNAALKAPKGKRLSLFALKKGITRIDILPYEVGNGNPVAEPGSFHFERTYWFHPQVGPGNEQVVCLRKTFGKRCPICDFRAKLAANPDADEDDLKSLLPKQRQLFNVIDLDNPDKGVQVMDIAPFNFGDLLDTKVSTADEGDEYHKFFWLDEGFSLRIVVKEDSFGGRKFNKAADIEFKVRKKQYPESILDETLCLDDCIVELDYDALNEKFLEARGEDDAPAKKKSKTGKGPAPKGKSKPKDEDLDDDDEDDEDLEDDDDEDEAPPTKKKSAKGKSKPDDDDEDDEDLEDDDDEDEGDEDLDDDDEDEDDEPSDDDDDDDEDLEDDDEDLEDDDDEDEAPPKKSSKATTSKSSKGKESRGAKSSDEDDDDEDDDDEDEDEDEDEAPVSVNQRIKFSYKGESLTGVVASINAAKKLYTVNVKGRSNPSVLGFNEKIKVLSK